MNKAFQTASKAIGWAVYIFVALCGAVMALLLSFISDGPVPLSFHIAMPAMVLFLFFAVPVIWRVTSKKVTAPVIIQRHQNKILVWGILIYLCLLLVSVMTGKR